MTAVDAQGRPLTGILRWIVSLSVMLCMILEMLDMTIVNVALPHMMGALGAVTDQITWVISSYMVASAIVMPLSGSLAQRFGRRKLLLFDIAAFVSASAMCGLAQSLGQMVFFRILQGLCGATLMPLAQSVMLELFPGRERGKGMAVFSVGILLAPTLGPTIGGFLTEYLNWRWVFYINVPVGILSFLLALEFMPDTPTRHVKTDWIGLVLLVATVGAVQLSLDLGSTKHWLQSQEIRIGLAVFAVAGGAFFLRTWGRENPIVDLTLFKDRNFAASSLMMFCMGLGLYGINALLPLMMQQLMHYPAETTGMLLAPRALAIAMCMPLVGAVLVPRFDLRILILIGLFISAASCFLQAGYAPIIGIWSLIAPGILAGVGMSLLFIPLSTLAYETMDTGRSIGATGVYNVMRTFGSSMGISVSSSILSQQNAVHWSVLGGKLSSVNPRIAQYLAHAGLSFPSGKIAIWAALNAQASMLSYTDTFWVIGVVFIAIAPLLLLTRHSDRKSSGPINRLSKTPAE
jgi:DHA2 family multidrug resistance protein